MIAMKKAIITVWLVSIFFPGILYPDVGDKQFLPRSFGPLSLGMTEKEFQTITGLTTYACEGCGPDEYAATIDIDRYPGIFPKYIYNLDTYKRGVDCAFYKGKLYKITIPPEVKEIESAKKKYTEAFGAPTKFDEWTNGLSWLIWENKATVFSLSYVRKKGNAYPLTLPVGTVSSVEYVDRIMRGQLDRHKKNR
jgi:hypothetical protein